MTPALAVMHIEGDVTAVHSHWTADRSRIVTDATVRTATGDVVVSQLGGSAEGYGMVTFPGLPPLQVGMRIAAGAHQDADLSGVMHLGLDTLKIEAMPPGFVRSGLTKSGKYLFWESGCVQVVVDAAGTKEIPGDQEFPIIDAAIAEWSTKTAGCSYFEIVNTGRARVEVGTDMVNVIKFRDSSWCRPAIGDDMMRCYSPDAAGLTTVIFVDDVTSSRDGAIVDADVEINGAGDRNGGFSIGTNGMTLGVGLCEQDLANTLTHELGHLQGLEHTCRIRENPERLDGQGHPVPLCEDTSDPAIVDATMYTFADCGETKKATIEADDIAGICAVYPKADDPGECKGVGDTGGCCSVRPGSPAGRSLPSATLPLLGLGALVLLRRRRRSARGTP